MTLRLKVGRKGYIILPKAIREVYGIREGDYVLVEVRGDGILIRPARRVNFAEVRGVVREHWEKLVKLNTLTPQLGELAKVSLEEEFEE